MIQDTSPTNNRAIRPRRLSTPAKLVLACAVTVLVGALGVAGAGLVHGYLFDPNRGFDPRCDAYWKLRFIGTHAGWWGEPIFAHERMHPTRGWVMQANRTHPESTDDRGHRGSGTFVLNEDAFRVMALGDSFTFGAEAGEGEDWPSLVGARDERLQMINFGVSGYGLGQMYLTLREEIEEYRPHVVICSPISPNVYRTLLSFREWHSPRYELDEQGELTLTNVPFPSVEGTIDAFLERYGYWSARWSLAEEQAEFDRRVESGEYDEEAMRVNVALIQAMADQARAHGAGYLLVHLAGHGEIQFAENDTGWTEFPAEAILKAGAQAADCRFVQTGPEFFARGADWREGHYLRPEAEVAADVIYEALTETPQWREYVEKADAR